MWLVRPLTVFLSLLSSPYPVTRASGRPCGWDGRVGQFLTKQSRNADLLSYTQAHTHRCRITYRVVCSTMLQYSIVSTLCYSSYGRLWCRSSCTGYPSNASVRVLAYVLLPMCYNVKRKGRYCVGTSSSDVVIAIDEYADVVGPSSHSLPLSLVLSISRDPCLGPPLLSPPAPNDKATTRSV